MPTNSTLFDTLTAVQQDVLQALVAGQSISAAAKAAGIHRSTVHLWTQKHPAFARALIAARHHRADLLLDELGGLAGLALDTFRHILSDESAPASVRLKAAMEISLLPARGRHLARLHPTPSTSSLTKFPEAHRAFSVAIGHLATSIAAGATPLKCLAIRKRKNKKWQNEPGDLVQTNHFRSQVRSGSPTP